LTRVLQIGDVGNFKELRVIDRNASLLAKVLRMHQFEIGKARLRILCFFVLVDRKTQNSRRIDVVLRLGSPLYKKSQRENEKTQSVAELIHSHSIHSAQRFLSRKGG